MDVKQRELNLLFRTYEVNFLNWYHRCICQGTILQTFHFHVQGYEGTFLRMLAKPGKTPQVFVLSRFFIVLNF